MPTAYELERAANIARNKALLEELELKEAVSSMAAPSKKTEREKKAKPIQPRKSVPKKETEDDGLRRQSARLRRTTVNPNETPAQKRKREKEIAERDALEAEERLVAEEEARRAKRPRHDDLDFEALAHATTEEEELPALRSTLSHLLETPYPRAIGDRDAFVFDEDVDQEDAALTDLRDRMRNLKVVSRAKVTVDRIYSGAYHPEPTKDLIFFGDKHGMLGIWDAQATPDEDEDDDRPPQEREGGKYWRLQMHWPATSKSSISSVKCDPIDAHSIYTSSYDCTVRQLSFTTGISREVFSLDEVLPCCVELTPSGHEMWISDTRGCLTHLDLRQPASSASTYQVATDKIGCVSVNPVDPHLLLTASNDRDLTIWDARKLHVLSVNAPEPRDFEYEQVTKFMSTKQGKGTSRGEWRHGRAIGAAHWDPHGRRIVSTSYDDTLRVWDFRSNVLGASGQLPSMKPAEEITHNTQSGRWVTPLKAQWSPNADVYPHFTVASMKQSLDIFSCKGEVVARLADKVKVTAVQAVTLSHPSVVERAASGNGSGRCVLWAPEDTEEEEADEAS